MFNIKYNYPHTFFLSVGIITLIFGVYPFYTNNFDLALIHWSKIVIHAMLLILSTVCIVKGLKLWDKKEYEKEEMAEIVKKKLKQTIELKELDLEERRDRRNVARLTGEIKALEHNKKEKKQTEQEIKKKKSEIEKLNKEILDKRKKIEEETSKLYEFKKEEISKTPDNFLLNPGSPTFRNSISGASISPTFPDILPTGVPSLVGSKKCSKCGTDYVPSIIFDKGVCSSCDTFDLFNKESL